MRERRYPPKFPVAWHFQAPCRHRNLATVPYLPSTSKKPSLWDSYAPTMPKFVPRQRKHKVLARQKSHVFGSGGQDGGAGYNAESSVILPAEQKAREAKKKEIKEELVAESKGKMGAKKKKRLDKYIVGSQNSMPEGKVVNDVSLGYQTQKRRESRDPQETRRTKSRYESVRE